MSRGHQGLLHAVDAVGCVLALAVILVIAWPLLAELTLANPLLMLLALGSGFAIGRLRSLGWKIGLLAGNAIVLASYAAASLTFWSGIGQPAAALLLWNMGTAIVGGSGLIVGAVTRIGDLRAPSPWRGGRGRG